MYLYIEIPRGIVGIELDFAVETVAKKKKDNFKLVCILTIK